MRIKCTSPSHYHGATNHTNNYSLNRETNSLRNGGQENCHSAAVKGWQLITYAVTYTYTYAYY